MKGCALRHSVERIVLDTDSCNIQHAVDRLVLDTALPMDSWMKSCVLVLDKSRVGKGCMV